MQFPNVFLYKEIGCKRYISDVGLDRIFRNSNTHIQAIILGPGRPRPQFCLDNVLRCKNYMTGASRSRRLRLPLVMILKRVDNRMNKSQAWHIPSPNPVIRTYLFIDFISYYWHNWRIRVCDLWDKFFTLGTFFEVWLNSDFKTFLRACLSINF